MCGINGFNWPDQEIIEKMNESIKHRGPDDNGVYLDEYVSLGNVRLSIIDLSTKGHQPMTNEDGSLWLVYNGEIYNFKELRIELERKGHKFISNTDTEVVLHAYEEWNEESLSRFNGMFAFSLYDTHRKILFLARDRFGIKPLYYYADKSKFIFSSEIKGLLQHKIGKYPNENAVFDFLYRNLIQHMAQTFFDDIFKLLPGHIMIYDLEKHTLDIKQWYRLPLKNIDLPSDEKATAQRVKEMLQDSVRLRIIADVPVGSCLSGGLDSSAIVCLMRSLLPEGDIHTFSAIFPGNKIDESRYINAVASHAKTASFTVSPTGSELGSDLFDLIRTQEEPFIGPSVYAQYRVMKMAHEQKIKVLLDGQGGDELFAGYTEYFQVYFYELLKNWQIGRLATESYYFYRNQHSLHPFIILGGTMLPDWGKRLLRQRHNPLVNKDFLESQSSREQRWQQKTLQQALNLSLTTSSIPQLVLYEDKNAMRWSIETRLPFLDYRLVEAALSIPPQYKLNQGNTKYLLRRAVNDILPMQVSNRKDKIGFEVPHNSWLSDSHLKSIINEIMLSDNTRSRPYINYEYFKKQFSYYLKEERSHKINFASLWKFLNLELWLREYFHN